MRGARDAQRELGRVVALPTGQVDQVGVDHVEVVEAEKHVDQSLAVAVLGLHGRHREPSVRPDLDLPGVDLLHQLQPRPRGPVMRERQAVEVHAVDLVGALYLGPGVPHQATGELRLVGEHAEHLEVRGVQDALERRLRPGRQRPEPGLQVAVQHHHLVVLARRGRVVAPARRQGDLRVAADDVLPVRPVLRGLQRPQLGGDEVGVAHPGRRRILRLVPVPDQPVVAEQLHQQAVEAPALGDRVDHREDQPPHARFEHHRGDPHQRRDGQVEERGPLPRGEPA